MTSVGAGAGALDGVVGVAFRGFAAPSVECQPVFTGSDTPLFSISSLPFTISSLQDVLILLNVHFYFLRS